MSRRDGAIVAWHEVLVILDLDQENPKVYAVLASSRRAY
jgi:hypothetical protein